MAIVIDHANATTNFSTGSRTITVNIPNNCAVGDVAMVVLSWDTYNNVKHLESSWLSIGKGDESVDVPTAMAKGLAGAVDDGGGMVLWKYINNDEDQTVTSPTNTSWTFHLSDDDDWCASAVRITGMGKSSIIHKAGTNYGDATNPSTPSVTTTIADCALVSVLCTDESRAITLDTDLTTIANFDSATTSIGCGIGWGYKILSGTATEGFNHTLAAAASYCGWTIAIQPAGEFEISDVLARTNGGGGFLYSCVQDGNSGIFYSDQITGDGFTGTQGKVFLTDHATWGSESKKVEQTVNGTLGWADTVIFIDTANGTGANEFTDGEDIYLWVEKSGGSSRVSFPVKFLHSGQPAIYDSRVATGTFASSATSGSSTAVSGLSFQPKAVLLWGCLDGTAFDTVESGASMFIGMSDGTNHECIGVRNEDAVADNDRFQKHTALAILNKSDNTFDIETGDDTNGSALEITSDGFKLNIPTTPDRQINVHYMAFGGADVEAKVMNFIGDNYEDLEVDDVGFKPDTFIMGTTIETDETPSGSGILSLGIMLDECTRKNIRPPMDESNSFCVSVYSSGTSNANKHANMYKGFGSLYVSTAGQYGASVERGKSDGFWMKTFSDDAHWYPMLLLKMNFPFTRMIVGVEPMETTAAPHTQTIDTGVVKPDAILGLMVRSTSVDITASPTTSSSDLSLSIGAAESKANQHSIHFNSERDAADADNVSSDSFLLAEAEQGAGAGSKGEVQDFSGSIDFDVIWNPSNQTAYYFGFLAIETVEIAQSTDYANTELEEVNAVETILIEHEKVLDEDVHAVEVDIKAREEVLDEDVHAVEVDIKAREEVLDEDVHAVEVDIKAREEVLDEDVHAVEVDIKAREEVLDEDVHAVEVDIKAREEVLDEDVHAVESKERAFTRTIDEDAHAVEDSLKSIEILKAEDVHAVEDDAKAREQVLDEDVHAVESDVKSREQVIDEDVHAVEFDEQTVGMEKIEDEDVNAVETILIEHEKFIDEDVHAVEDEIKALEAVVDEDIHAVEAQLEDVELVLSEDVHAVDSKFKSLEAVIAEDVHAVEDEIVTEAGEEVLDEDVHAVETILIQHEKVLDEDVHAVETAPFARETVTAEDIHAVEDEIVTEAGEEVLDEDVHAVETILIQHEKVLDEDVHAVETAPLARETVTTEDVHAVEDEIVTESGEEVLDEDVHAVETILIQHEKVLDEDVHAVETAPLARETVTTEDVHAVEDEIVTEAGEEVHDEDVHAVETILIEHEKVVSDDVHAVEDYPIEREILRSEDAHAVEDALVYREVVTDEDVHAVELAPLARDVVELEVVHAVEDEVIDHVVGGEDLAEIDDNDVNAVESIAKDIHLVISEQVHAVEDDAKVRDTSLVFDEDVHAVEIEIIVRDVSVIFDENVHASENDVIVDNVSTYERTFDEDVHAAETTLVDVELNVYELVHATEVFSRDVEWDRVVTDQVFATEVLSQLDFIAVDATEVSIEGKTSSLSLRGKVVEESIEAEVKGTSLRGRQV